MRLLVGGRCGGDQIKVKLPLQTLFDDFHMQKSQKPASKTCPQGLGIFHLVSKSSKLPISIQNNYPAEIRVQVHVAPSNLDALIPAVVEVTVPANTTYVAQVPVTAIADGEVTLRSWITTFSGLPLGEPVDLKLVINAEIENSAIAGFAVVVLGLGVVGVFRTRAKRRAATSIDDLENS